MSHWQQIFEDASEKSFFSVNRITHYWIIWNKKPKKISLRDKLMP